MHLQMSHMVTQNKSLLKDNTALSSENTRLKKVAPHENSHALKQEVDRLQAQLEKEKENQQLFTFFDDREKVERETKREIDSWIEKDRQATLE